MLEQLRTVVGRPGPLIIETQHGLINEPCMIIREEHVQRALQRLASTSDALLEQTSDRSFIVRKIR